MKIALAQINSTVGDFKANTQKIINEIARAHNNNCDLIVFPEAALYGYHPFDFLERKKSVTEQLKCINKIKKSIPADLGVLLGCFTINPHKGRPYFNSACFLTKGKQPQFFHKELLPTGDVFDEARFIEPAIGSDKILSWKGQKILVSICEDMWAWDVRGYKNPYSSNPLFKYKSQNINFAINLSASPFHIKKWELRKSLLAKMAQTLKVPCAYVNLVGGQDEIVFDGQSFAVDKAGTVQVKAQGFVEDFCIWIPGGVQKVKLEKAKPAEALRQALVLGLRDYCFKNKIDNLHLGLSGGIDSAIVAALAVDAIGAHHVVGVSLPGPFSSDESFVLAEQLAKNLQIKFKEFSITSVYNSLERSLSEFASVSEFGLMHENLQARLRGLVLMAYSNAKGSMLLSTSNKSEIATGYSTLYGDMCGGLCPIGDLTKKQVYDLAKLYNSEIEIIPNQIIARAPSAELKPNQKDQDTLPEYDLLDASVVRLVELQKEKRSKIDQFVIDRIQKSEFKRWQAPPILKISSHSFGRGRRYPITNRFLE